MTHSHDVFLNFCSQVGPEFYPHGGHPCSVAQLRPTLCDPMDCSTPGFPVLHHLPELAETHVHRVGDAIQPSHPLASPSPPAFDACHIRVFSSESVLRIGWPQDQSFSIYPHYRHLILLMPGGSGTALLDTDQKSLRF